MSNKEGTERPDVTVDPIEGDDLGKAQISRKRHTQEEIVEDLEDSDKDAEK
jgi:hypothetical protein